MIEAAGIGIAAVMPEIPTILMENGISLDPRVWEEDLAASEELFLMIYEWEERFYSMLKRLRSGGKPLILLIDRPLRDSWTYIGRENYLKVISKFGFDPHQLLSRYKAVLHFVTPAKGFEQYYTQANNVTRSENAEGSRKLDEPTFASWKGHPHHLIVNPTKTPNEKIVNAFTLLKRVLPMGKEIERKWLLRGFPEHLIPREAASSELEQTYLVEDPEMLGVERRVRLERQDGTSTYRRTWKSDTDSSIERDEKDPPITLAEFEKLVTKEADPTRATILKRRYRVRADDRIIEVDKYHDIPGYFTAEVEFPTREAAAQFVMPLPFARFAVPVDGIKLHKNANIARLLKEGRAHELLDQPISAIPQA